jgi:hypothetical protein
MMLSSPLTYPLPIYLPTCPSTFLLTSLLGRYLPSPTYLVAPTYMIVTPIDPTIAKNDEKINKMKIFHRAWT